MSTTTTEPPAAGESEEERHLRSVTDMTNGDGEVPAGVEEEEDGQLAIAGTKPNLNLTAGGTKPTVSVAKIKALKLPVQGDLSDPSKAGQFEKGDTIRAVIDLVVTDVNFHDERRKGKVERTQRVHIFEPLAIEVIPADAAAGK